VLLALSLASAAFLVTTIVTLRIAYLHHTGASVPVWPLIGISLSVLFVDVSASALRHNPWPAKRTQLVDDEDDVKEALRTAEEAVVVTGKKVMVTQANLATALEKLLDSHFVHWCPDVSSPGRRSAPMGDCVQREHSATLCPNGR
jgi:hypothetical protein